MSFIMEETLIQIKNDAMSLLLEADKEDVEQIFIEFLGKKGRLTLAMKELPKLEPERRSEIGKLANEIKDILEEQISDKRQQLKNLSKQQRAARDKEASYFDSTDVTMPGNKPPLGSLHLVTQAIEEITAIFEKIGFTKVRYPEVEYDWYAFGALNFPENHPARDDWETFFVDMPEDPKKGPIVLTPHTSSGQVREMERTVARLREQGSSPASKAKTGVDDAKKEENNNVYSGDKLKIKMLNIAKCYRRQSDVSHTQMFHQFEGLVVGEGINISHLKGVLEYFVKSYFGVKREFRIRPYHFQFTEPSFEIDVTCGVCNGAGCKLCKAGWLEMGGSGMVHPNVLKAGKIDPQKYSGFAFGWGVERVLMMKAGLKIDDLRTLYSNELSFLEQF